MNINFCLTKHYGNFCLIGRRKNKANSNPIKPNLRKAEMNLSSVKTKDYRNELPLRPTAKKTQNKPNQTQSNPIKPNFKTRWCGRLALSSPSLLDYKKNKIRKVVNFLNFFLLILVLSGIGKIPKKI